MNFSPTSSDNCSVESIVCIPASGSAFPVGTTTVECTAIDGAGNQTGCSFDVTVTDNEPPILTVIADPITLWPPNHKYETIDISQLFISVTDNYAYASCQVHVPQEKGGVAIEDDVAYQEFCGGRSLLIAKSSDVIQLMNYPNPFSGNTHISFKINETNNTTLKVYDTYGKHVATLFDNKAEEGQQYKFEFSAGNLPKGIYIYHLQSGNNISVVKKIILMK